MDHDSDCELARPDNPTLPGYHNRVTGVTYPPMPWPCHCLARQQGRERAARDNARCGC